MSESDGRTKRNGRDAIDETQDVENGRPESWQAGPSTQELSNADYTRDINKPTGRSRTDLRAIDRHASWREVYRQCHVGVGMNE